jgi:hypothetical protein
MRKVPVPRRVSPGRAVGLPQVHRRPSSPAEPAHAGAAGLAPGPEWRFCPGAPSPSGLTADLPPPSEAFRASRGFPREGAPPPQFSNEFRVGNTPVYPLPIAPAALGGVGPDGSMS